MEPEVVQKMFCWVEEVMDQWADVCIGSKGCDHGCPATVVQEVQTGTGILNYTVCFNVGVVLFKLLMVTAHLLGF